MAMWRLCGGGWRRAGETAAGRERGWGSYGGGAVRAVVAEDAGRLVRKTRGGWWRAVAKLARSGHGGCEVFAKTKTTTTRLRAHAAARERGKR